MDVPVVNSTLNTVTELERALGLSAHISPWISVPVVLLVWVLFFVTIKKFAFSVIRKLASKTGTQVDNVFFDALGLPIHLMIYATGILVAQNWIPRSGMDISRYLMGGFKVVSILAVVLFVDKFLRGMVSVYASRLEVLRTAGGIVQGTVRVIVFGLGILVVLDSMGVSITPIIASLGIGSLAVALALQPTLENFFSGIQILADKPIQVGQFIRLESGEEGTVVKIGWRSTWVCQSNNNTVIIPNKVLVGARVTNYFYPDMEIAVVVPVGVHYHSDLEKVERVAVDVARGVMTGPGGIAAFEPFIRYTAFNDSSISFNVILRAKDWPSTHLVRHEYIKQLQKRFSAEGIVIPYPIRTILQGK